MRSLIVLISFLAAAGSAMAQLSGENLIVDQPAGYKIVSEARKGNMVMTEMVPSSESVQDWTEMLTTQVFHGLKTATPQAFRDFMQALAARSCPGGQAANIAEGEENGYPFALWIQDCPRVQQTGKPLRTWFKVVRGRDSFYVVQKAFKFEPSEEQVSMWTRFLRDVYVCDTRVPDRKCSEGRSGG